MIGICAETSGSARRGRPLLFSLTEAVVLVLVAAALVATAAVPAVLRHPHVAQAKTVAENVAQR